ncbi:hypothetical protein ABZ297_10795 [Nonomuraea sp. NPDC005983]|uniref:hypothetical protein n=1 Tax=Nonomuraea sp. NPDC005983 TaxID=3155595 RepID=UPI0033B4CC62
MTSTVASAGPGACPPPSSGSDVAYGAPSAAEGDVRLALERLDGLGARLRPGDVMRFRVRFEGVAREASLTVSASPAAALSTVTCAPAQAATPAPQAGIPPAEVTPAQAGARVCPLGEVSGERTADVLVSVPEGAKEVGLSAVAQLREPTGPGMAIVSRATRLPVGDSVVEAAPAGVAPAGVAPDTAATGEDSPRLPAANLPVQGEKAHRAHSDHHRAGLPLAEVRPAVPGRAEEAKNSRRATAAGVKEAAERVTRPAQRESSERARPLGTPVGPKVTSGWVTPVAPGKGGERASRPVPDQGATPLRLGNSVTASRPEGSAVRGASEQAQRLGQTLPQQAPVVVGSPHPVFGAPQGTSGLVAGAGPVLPTVVPSEEGEAVGAPLPLEVTASGERPRIAEPAHMSAMLAGARGVPVVGAGIAVLLAALWVVAGVQRRKLRRKVV